MPTKDQLKDLQSKSLEEKIPNFNRPNYRVVRNLGEEVYISNSGGVDRYGFISSCPQILS